MRCTCTTGDARNPDTHNNQVRTNGRCRCMCHTPGYKYECASCSSPGSWDLCRNCGGR